MQSSRIRFASCLLLATLAVRAVVPTGYMPGKLLHGEFMVLCPVASAATVQMLQGAHGHDHGNSGQETASISIACPIGSSLYFDALPTLDTPELVFRRHDERPQFIASISYVHPTTRAYPARGPPHS